MSTAQKIIASTSGVGGEGANVEDVFSTFVYSGTGSSQTITNNIDLNGEGGLVWIKRRDDGENHGLYDTERGVGKRLSTNNVSAEATDNNGLSAFRDTGFTVVSSDDSNKSGGTYVSWTFRKASKFFDVLTYNGDGGSGNKQVSHNLGATPGAVIIRKYNGSGGDWLLAHTAIGLTTKFHYLNGDNAAANGSIVTAADSSTITFSRANGYNNSGESYVVYLFAHNNNDGGFGVDADADIIKCGSYTGNGSDIGVFQDLGFEPQWIICKVSSATDPWIMLDNMRGVTGAGSTDPRLTANLNYPEQDGAIMKFDSTGFTPITTDGKINGNGKTYIYIAIRRGQMKAPENATDVFAIENYTGTGSAGNRSTSILVDAIITTRPAVAEHKYLLDRLRTSSKWLRTETNEAEGTQSTGRRTFGNNFLQMLGSGDTINSSSFNYVNYLFRRAPEFFDLVAYTGDGNTAKTIKHNLNAVPKLIIIKGRSFTSEWIVYFGSGSLNVFFNTDDTQTGLGAIHKTGGAYQAIDSTTQFDVEKFTGGNASKSLNTSGENYIALIFGNLGGISKVGSYVGTGSDLDVDCGFSNGVKFVFIKKTDNPKTDWYLFDAVRGIGTGADPAGRDPALFINKLSSDLYQGTDFINSINSGFKVRPNSGTLGKLNTSGGNYIFYAIAV